MIEQTEYFYLYAECAGLKERKESIQREIKKQDSNYPDLQFVDTVNYE